MTRTPYSVRALWAQAGRGPVSLRFEFWTDAVQITLKRGPFYVIHNTYVFWRWWAFSRINGSYWIADNLGLPRLDWKIYA